MAIGHRSMNSGAPCSIYGWCSSASRLSQRLVKPNPKSFIGSGKVEELCGLVHRVVADVIFDDDLTPSQQSYLEPWASR